MNRTDRLYALVEELRAAPGARSAAWLAQRFEFSVRTLQRDVLALQEAGVPIWATPGPGGGYAIGPGHTLPPLNFTASEAAAVALAMARSAPMPFGGAARSALHKVVAAMSAAGRGSAAVRTCTVNAPVSRVASQSADVESIQAEQAGPQISGATNWRIRPSVAASLVGLGSTIGVRCPPSRSSARPRVS